MQRKSIALFYIVLVLGTKSCHSQKNDSIVFPETEFASRFFKWYLNEIKQKGQSYYQIPTYKKIDSKTYVFDIAEFKKRLEKITFFSNEFKQQLVTKLNLCNSEMKKIVWDFEPESQFNIKACNYLWFDNWVGGQGENISGYEVLNELAEHDCKLVTIQIMVDEKPFTKTKVKVVRIDGSFKISDMELDWKK